MAVIRCKMCGGDLLLDENTSIATCEYCGSVQTIPKVDNEKKLERFERAERLRKQCEFDRAAGHYEAIVGEFPQEAEAHWGLVLCKFGVEYVDDPATGKKIPTCHRSSFDSVMEDNDFDLVMENADPIARRVYRAEAKAIEEIRKGIISVSANEDPYDIFICYKETDDKGERTLDSVLAQDIYNALVGKGYRVFFSRISLEDKLGMEYEPYIFAALNSAKIMLVVGTDYEYFTAVWVKNEWSRFLKLMSKDRSKYLIPCYKNIDAYDMPKEFSRLQAQDLSKLGAIQDLLRGVEKLLPLTTVEGSHSSKMHPVVDPLLKLLFVFLEQGDWISADEYGNKVLDIDPECAQAYLGKLMVGLRVRTESQLTQLNEPIDSNYYYQKALRYADNPLRTSLLNYARIAADRAQQVQIARAKREEEERIAREEAERVARAKREEEERIAREEAERVARAKREEEEQIARERREARDRIIREERRLIREKREKREQEERLARLKWEEEERIANANAENLAVIRNGWKGVQKRLVVSSGHAVGLLMDGTVVAAGTNYDGRCGVETWQNIIGVGSGSFHTMGVKSNGTVVCAGDHEYGKCNVGHWRNIVSVAAGLRYTVGLKSDGTVMAEGDNSHGQCDVEYWQNVIALSAGDEVVLGLKSDGTVCMTGKFRGGRCDVKDWQTVVSVCVGGQHIVGLRHNGMVVATGDNHHGQGDVQKWRNIVAVSAGAQHTVALQSDGAVVATGRNDYGQCNVDGWTDIVAVFAGEHCSVGIQSDGTIVTAGNGVFLPEIQGWRLFQDVSNLSSDHEVDTQRCNLGVCLHCGGTFKGLLAKTCSVCGKPKDY